MAWILVGKESALAEVRKICSPIIYIFRQVGTSGRFRFECDAGVSKVTQSLVTVFGPWSAASSPPSTIVFLQYTTYMREIRSPQFTIDRAFGHAKLPSGVGQITENHPKRMIKFKGGPVFEPSLFIKLYLEQYQVRVSVVKYHCII
jgi:hypothetical protein